MQEIDPLPTSSHASKPQRAWNVEKKREHVFITHIRATDVVSGLRRLPAGFYVAVEIDGKTTECSNQPVLMVGEDDVKWNEKILLPSRRSSVVSFKVYASFEFGPRLGHGQLLRQFKIVVGDVLDHCDQRLPIHFQAPKDDETVSPCSSLSIIIERRMCDVHHSATRPDPPVSNVTSELAQLTDAGHRALLCYRQLQNQSDLDEAITYFELVCDMCPSDYPSRSAALFNLANARFIHSQANDARRDLDLSAALYRDALQLRGSGHLDHFATALYLGIALLARFYKRGDETDKAEAKDLLSTVVELSPAGSYGNQVAYHVLVMAGIPLSTQITEMGTPPTDSAYPDNEELIRAVLLAFPDRNPRRPALLAHLGTLLYHRFNRDGSLVDIHEAISTLGTAVQLIADGHLDKSVWLIDLGSSLSRRFERLGDPGDISMSVSAFQEAIRLAPDAHPNKSAWLSDLGNALSCRFQRLGGLGDLNECIVAKEASVRLTADSNPDKPARLSTLGGLFLKRYERLNGVADVNKSVWAFEEAVRLTPDGHSSKPARLNGLGSSLSRRFERLGDTTDINKSISVFEEAVRLTPDSGPNKASWLGNLGSALSLRFQRFGDLADVNKSISVLEETVCLAPNSHLKKPIWLSGLGTAFFHRFRRLGDLTDMNKSILAKEEAVSLTPDSHPLKPAWLNNLGNSLLVRFERLGDRSDINKSVSLFEKAVHLTPENHPNKVGWLNNLGNSLLRRSEGLGDPADLDQSISVFEEALRLTPDSHPNKPTWLNNLGTSLSRRFQQLGDLEDINRSVWMREEAVRLTPDGHPNKSICLSNLGNSLFHRFQRLGDLSDMTKSTSIIEEAVRLTPDDHPDKPARFITLGNSLLKRFERLGDLAYLNKSILAYKEAVRLTPDDHPRKPATLNNFGSSLLARFELLGDLGDVNKSISVKADAVRLTPDGHLHKPARLNSLGLSLSRRFERLGDHADMNKSISVFAEAVALTHDGHPDKSVWLNSLGNSLSVRFKKLGDLGDLSKSISVLEEAVHLTTNDNPDKPVWLSNLGNSLSRRFEKLGDLTDMNQALLVLEEAVGLVPDDHPIKPACLKNFGGSLSHRFEQLGDPADLKQSISVFKQAASASIGPTSIRFAAACCWISSLRREGHSQALLDAYTTTINLLPQLAWLGLPITERHRVLLDAADIARDAAAAALDAGHPETAVEWLEQGRSIVWNQFLQLRTPVDELDAEHPDLARQFKQVSQQLERAGSHRGSTVHTLENEVALEPVSLEEEVQRHHELALQRDKLLDEIRSLPSFERFMLPRKMEQLATWACSGPVIYLNASKHSCDALIVMPGLEHVVPVHLPVNYQQVRRLWDLLRGILKHKCLISREDIPILTSSEESPVSLRLLETLVMEDGVVREGKVGTQRNEGYSPNALFQQILAYLWKAVVHPILSAIGFLTPQHESEKLDRIFWCPTGPFTFLPIHAAGIYGTAETDAKLSDFAISSYIPSLSSFAPSAPSPKPTQSPSPEKIRLLAVPQPSTDGLNKLQFAKDEVDQIKLLFSGSRCVSVQESVSGTLEDVVHQMQDCSWVHFACHGVQDHDHPLDSGLCLANARRLTLSDILRLSSRPRGGLAFLSACQTAQGDEMLSEEAVHLAAGMLLAGYGGTIATMWSIMDAVAPKVTRAVYEYLLREPVSESRVLDSTKAAAALHDAVRRLRDSGAPLTSWVPFIHVGR